MTEIDVDIDTPDPDISAELIQLQPAPLGTPRSFASLVAQGAVELPPIMLGTADKQGLAHNHISMDLLAMGELNGDKGPYWAHLVELDGHRCTFRLQQHPARDTTAYALMTLLQDGPVTGVQLRCAVEKFGNCFLLLVPAEENA